MADESKEAQVVDHEKTRLADENRKMRATEKAAKDKETAAAADKHAKDGEELEQLRKDHAALTESLGVYRKRDGDVADALFAALPEDRQKHLAVVKESLSPEKWLDFLKGEQTTPNDDEGDDEGEEGGPPPKVSRGDGRVTGTKGYKVKNREWIEDNMAVDEIRHLPTLEVDDEGLGTRFWMKIKPFMKRLKSNPGVFMDKKALEDRRK